MYLADHSKGRIVLSVRPSDYVIALLYLAEPWRFPVNGVFDWTHERAMRRVYNLSQLDRGLSVRRCASGQLMVT